MGEPTAPSFADIERFGDVPVPVEVRIGSRQTTIREVFALKAGNIVILDRPAGESLDLLIGDYRMASVEVVVVDDRLAVRIMEFDRYTPSSSQAERASS